MVMDGGAVGSGSGVEDACDDVRQVAVAGDILPFEVGGDVDNYEIEDWSFAGDGIGRWRMWCG